MEKKNDAPAEIETITLTMSRPVAEAVQIACEWYLRMHMGQFWAVADDLCLAKFRSDMENGTFKTEGQEDNAFKVALDRRNSMREEMEQAYNRFVLPAPISDVMKVPYRAEIVWLVIRHALAWHDNPEGMLGCVSYYDPMNRSDQPEPKIELNKIEPNPVQPKGYDELIKVGDLVYSKILKTAGTVIRANRDDYIIADFDMRNGSTKRWACEWNDLVLIERKNVGSSETEEKPACDGKCAKCGRC